jgi:hypothetical protein
MSGIYWLASYPKSGNTWFRIVLHNFQHNGAAPSDINAIDVGMIASARTWLDDVLGFDTADLLPEEVDWMRARVYRWSLQEEAIGYHKIHDCCLTLPNGELLIDREATRGVLYIVRNPLDIAPSLAHYDNISIDKAIRGMGNSTRAASRSVEKMSVQVSYHLSTWSEHALSWVDAPGLRCLVIRYEDLLAEPLATFTRALQFLELPATQERVERAIRFSDFAELSRQEREKGFREQPLNGSRFFRQGLSGGWRTQLTPAQVRQVVADHGAVMRRFGYLDERGEPC